MTPAQITREQILTSLEEALEPLDFVKAMWQGGAAAFGRVDEWSDVDVVVISTDEKIEQVFDAAEKAIESLSPILERFEFPQPTWHGHFQIIYRLADASPFLYVDFVVMKESNPARFLEKQIHGSAVSYFDKGNFLAQDDLDIDAHLEKMKARAKDLEFQFGFFQELITKELKRENWLEALNFYQNFILRPLLEILRMQHSPSRFNFFTRYAYYDLPPDIVQTIEALFFLQSGPELAEKLALANKNFAKAFKNLDWQEIEEKLRKF